MDELEFIRLKNEIISLKESIRKITHLNDYFEKNKHD